MEYHINKLNKCGFIPIGYFNNNLNHHSFIFSSKEEAERAKELMQDDLIFLLCNFYSKEEAKQMKSKVKWL